MTIKYTFNNLSPREQEFLERVLLDELDFQTWFAIAYSDLLEDEIFLTLH